MDISLLEKLLPLLKANDVAYFKDAEVCIRLIPNLSQKSDLKPELTEAQKQSLPEFMADDAMNFDKIRDWSASPDHDTAPLPLTGEDLLDDPA